MRGLSDLIGATWFAAGLLIGALVAGGGVLLLRRRRGTVSYPLLFLAAILGLLGIGGLAMPDPWWGLWLVVGVISVFSVMLLVLVLSGSWWAPLGYALGSLLVPG